MRLVLLIVVVTVPVLLVWWTLASGPPAEVRVTRLGQVKVRVRGPNRLWALLNTTIRDLDLDVKELKAIELRDGHRTLFPRTMRPVAVPGLITIGKIRNRGSRGLQYWATHRGGKVLDLHFDGVFERVIIQVDDPEAVALELAERSDAVVRGVAPAAGTATASPLLAPPTLATPPGVAFPREVGDAPEEERWPPRWQPAPSPSSVEHVGPAPINFIPWEPSPLRPPPPLWLSWLRWSGLALALEGLLYLATMALVGSAELFLTFVFMDAAPDLDNVPSTEAVVRSVLWALVAGGVVAVLRAAFRRQRDRG